MSKYDYVSAQTVEDAVRLLNEPGKRCIPLAGGTDIFVALRVNPLWFDRLVDISRIPELHQITLEGDQVTLGAAVTHSKVAKSPLIKKIAPFLSAGCESVGGPAIRNAGTVGGNVANAAACADSLPSLACLETIAYLRSPQGQRQVPAEELITAPHKTQIQPGEIITHFTFKKPSERAKSWFIKIGRRNAQSISRLSLAVIGSTNDAGIVDYIRICPGAAAATTIRFRSVEELILGEKPSKELVAAAGDRMVAEMIERTGRRWSTPYKEIALKAIAERALSNIFLQDGCLC